MYIKHAIYVYKYVGIIRVSFTVNVTVYLLLLLLLLFSPQDPTAKYIAENETRLPARPPRGEIGW